MCRSVSIKVSIISRRNFENDDSSSRLHSQTCTVCLSGFERLSGPIDCQHEALDSP